MPASSAASRRLAGRFPFRGRTTPRGLGLSSDVDSGVSSSTSQRHRFAGGCRTGATAVPAIRRPNAGDQRSSPPMIRRRTAGRRRCAPGAPRGRTPVRRERMTTRDLHHPFRRPAAAPPRVSPAPRGTDLAVGPRLRWRPHRSGPRQAHAEPRAQSSPSHAARRPSNRPCLRVGGRSRRRACVDTSKPSVYPRQSDARSTYVAGARDELGSENAGAARRRAVAASHVLPRLAHAVVVHPARPGAGLRGPTVARCRRLTGCAARS